MIQVIPLQPLSQTFDIELDGYQTRFEIFYSQYLERWQMNLENVTLGTNVDGIPMNVSIDLLASAGSLDLQVIMLINMEGLLAEATVGSLGSDHQLVYMDLATYFSSFFDESIIIREIFRIINLQRNLSL